MPNDKKNKGKTKADTPSHADVARQLFAINKRAVLRDYIVNPIRPRLSA